MDDVDFADVSAKVAVDCWPEHVLGIDGHWNGTLVVTKIRKKYIILDSFMTGSLIRSVKVSIRWGGTNLVVIAAGQLECCYQKTRSQLPNEGRIIRQCEGAQRD